MMVYNTQIYWVFWKLENTSFLKLDVFLSTGEGEGTYAAGFLRKS
jgi:hypothetical protein